MEWSCSLVHVTNVVLNLYDASCPGIGISLSRVSFLLCRMKAFLPEASDMEMDVPQLWQYIGNFLAPVVCVHPEIVKTVSDYPLLEEIGRRAKFVAEVLKAILRSGKVSD